MILSLFAVVMLPCTGSAFAGQQRNHPFVVTELWHDLGHLVKGPDLYAVVGIVGLAPVAMRPAFEHEEPEFTEMWATEMADRFFELGAGMGAAIYPVSASILCLSLGRLERSGKMESFGSSLFRAQAINGFLTVSLKGAINRTRPDGAPYSYPSGHASSAFTTAAVIQSHFGTKWGVPAFAAATYVGLSRLQENKHYMSDVIAGAILGSYIGFKVAGKANGLPGIGVSPVIISESQGIALSVRF